MDDLRDPVHLQCRGLPSPGREPPECHAVSLLRLALGKLMHRERELHREARPSMMIDGARTRPSGMSQAHSDRTRGRT